MVDIKSTSLEDHMEALSIAKDLGNRAMEGAVSFDLGSAYYKLGDFQQAIEYYTKSLSIAKELGKTVLEKHAFYNLGRAYYNLGDIQRAIEYHTQSLSIAKELGDRAIEGDASLKLGNAFRDLRDFQQAIEYYLQSLSIAKEVGDRASEGDAYFNLGSAYYDLRDFQQAIEYYTQSLSIAKEVGDRSGEEGASLHLGKAYLNLRDFQQATEYFSQSLSIAKELKDKAREEVASSKLGEAYEKLGDFQQAMDSYTNSLSIAKEMRDREKEWRALSYLGGAYRSLGNFKQAIECHKEGLSIAKKVGDRDGEGNACRNVGCDYLELGNFKQATEYLKQALTIAKEIGNKQEEGKAYINLGAYYNFCGSFKQAIENYKQGLSICKEEGNSADEALAYGGLGIVYQVLGDFEEAIEYHKHYLGIAKEAGHRAVEGRACGALGDAYFSLGNFEEAIEYHKQLLSIAKETGDRVGEGSAYYFLGRHYEATASFSKAIDNYRSSVRLFDCTLVLLQSEDAWKIGFRDRCWYAYTALWRVLLKTGKTDEALCAAEQGRAQALRDVLKRQYGVDSLPSGTAESKETISFILNELSTQTVFLALSDNIICFWVLQKGKEILLKLTKIERGDASMLMEAALVEIGAGVRVRCENRSMDELGDEAQTTREAVEEIYQSCTSSVNSLRPLYEAIIGPVADLLQGDQLIIVPDGPFCLAPYSALSKSIRIRVVPSLTAFQLIAGAPDDFHCKSGALLVGDPCLDEVPMGLSQLSYARKEVDMIGKLLKTTPLTGKDATKDEVVKRLQSVALVHIAAHGCAQTGEIVLALDPSRKSQPLRKEDFILTMSDVQAVCLRARLVVLSCCHSGRGEVNSEGVVGIARSFLCAGARSVLVSLWAIDDEATMVFMERFYQHLADGKSASVALHQAMKSLRESEEFSAVKYWAPFVLIGDDVTLEFGEPK